MQLSEIQYNLIQNYLRDELSSADQVLFNEEIKNPAFKNELLDQANILNSIEVGYDNDLRKTLNSLEVAPKEVELNSGKEIPIIRTKASYWLKYAAIFVFGLASYFVVNNYLGETQSDLYAEYYSVYPADISRGAQEESIQLNKALVTYQEKNYKNAEALFNTLGANSPEAQFYSAMCQIELGKYKEATATLNGVIQSGSQFKSDAEWYQIMIYLKTEQHSNLDSSLSKIIGQADHPYHSNALELQKSLKP